MTDPEFCSLVGLMQAYLDRNPVDGAERLKAFLEDDRLLIETGDVSVLTGWSTGYITRLCKQGLLPYIPGSPHKFMIKPLRMALEQLQTGGVYGRRKARLKPGTKKP